VEGAVAVVSPARRNRIWLDRLSFFFLFSWLFGAYSLFWKGPAANDAQQAFRVAVFAVGLVGTLIIWAVKAFRAGR
jgi:hypothetical protein